MVPGNFQLGLGFAERCASIRIVGVNSSNTRSFGSMAHFRVSFFVCLLLVLVDTSTEDEVDSSAMLYKIEGKVQVGNVPLSDWAPHTKVIVDGGRFVGFIKQDGSFVVNNVPSGSYLVEVSSPDHVFEPARVDISSKSGKMRARKSDLLRPTAVTSLPYPLKFKAQSRANFFTKREEWSLAQTLMNPMVKLYCNCRV